MFHKIHTTKLDRRAQAQQHMVAYLSLAGLAAATITAITILLLYYVKRCGSFRGTYCL
jgi:hypothetical protein